MDVLDLTSYITQESEEITAYKARVKEVAERYAARNSWCGEVAKALREVGIGVEPKVVLDVTIAGLWTVRQEVAVRSLVNRTAEEQCVVVARGMGAMQINSTSVTILPEHITGMCVHLVVEGATATEPSGMGHPESEAAQGWFYSSGEGRVRHYFHDMDTRQPGVLSNPGPSRRGPWRTSLCDVVSSSELLLRSSRGENRRCARCEAAFERRIRN